MPCKKDIVKMRSGLKIDEIEVKYENVISEMYLLDLILQKIELHNLITSSLKLFVTFN